MVGLEWVLNRTGWGWRTNQVWQGWWSSPKWWIDLVILIELTLWWCFRHDDYYKTIKVSLQSSKSRSIIGIK